MPKYTVADGHKKHDGKKYAPGDVIECSEAVAERLRLVPVEDKPPVDPDDKKQEPPKKLSAEEAIAAIGECTTIDQVKEFFKGEDRVTVKNAAKAKLAAIKDAAKAAEKK
jgi:hypothetical protein